MSNCAGGGLAVWSVCLLLHGSGLQAQADCELKQLIVGNATGEPGETVTVELLGGISCEVTGFSLGIGHDPARVRFVDAAPGQFLLDLQDSDGDLRFSVEGLDDRRWVLLDYGDTVVHVFLDDEREIYRLDRLYADAPDVEWTPAGRTDAAPGPGVPNSDDV